MGYPQQVEGYKYLGRPRKSREEQVMNYTVHNTGCWIHNNSPNRNGYVQLTRGKKSVQAHRESYEINVGDIPEGLCVLHRCDVRSCINPEHLFLGTYADNANDMFSKGRALRSGEHNPRSVLSDSDRQDIIGFHILGLDRKDIARMYGVSISTIDKTVNLNRKRND